MKGKHYVRALVYAFAALFQIQILLHYLGCTWIFIGSDNFIDFEGDLVPWRLANDDFKDMTQTQLIIYATYWVCEVITTVGYGDYAGGTTIEYLFTLFLEFLGFVIFAGFYVAVLQIVQVETSWKAYVNMLDLKALYWFS